MMHNIKLLIVGPNAYSRQGGIAAVIKKHLTLFESASHISTISSENRFSNFFEFIKSCLRLIFELINSKKVIVHLHGASNGSFIRKYFLIIICKLFNAFKIVYQIHGGGFVSFYNKNYLTKMLVKHGLYLSDHIVVLSSNVKDKFIKDLNIPKNKIFIIPNSINIVEYSRKMTYSFEKLTILFMGKINRDKGIYDLVDVIRDILDDNIYNIKLIIAGYGEIDKLIDRIDKMALKKSVEYVGYLGEIEKRAYMKQSNLFILPSYKEAMPVSILEAMAFSLPVISTSVGAIPEIVKQNYNGILIEPGNKQQLKDAILYYLNSEISLFENIGKRNRELISSNFSDEEVKKILINLYER